MKSVILGFLLFGLVGCGPYVLRGKVVPGPASGIMVVNSDDPRLKNFGLSAATLQLTLDPDSLARKVIAAEQTNADGSFAIPIDAFGAGLLEYDFSLVARCEDYQSAKKTFRLPSRSKWFLVTLATGPDSYREPEDPLRDARPYLKDR